MAALRTRGHRETRTFSMTTRSLLEMADWFREHHLTHVAMEPGRASTGSPSTTSSGGYDFELLLVNPHEFKAMPGRKTDVRDAEWLADLLRHGLLRPSFVPDRA